jgi:hypothetical protein
MIPREYQSPVRAVPSGDQTKVGPMRTSCPLLLVPLILALPLVSSCSDVTQPEGMEPTETEAPVEIFFGPEEKDPRSWMVPDGMAGLDGPQPAAIDTSLYPIHARDNYYDYLYLKPIPNIGYILSGFYAYEGKYVHNNYEFDAAVIYHKPTKTWSGTIGYFNNQVFNYNVKWLSTNYFRGTYCTMHPSSSYTNKQRDVRVSILKGSFPGMNN